MATKFSEQSFLQLCKNRKERNRIAAIKAAKEELSKLLTKSAKPTMLDTLKCAGIVREQYNYIFILYTILINWA